MPPTVSPSLDDPVPRGASTLIGGPVGAHARRRPPRWFLAPLALLMLATTVTFGLGYLQKKPCRDHGWTKEYQYTRMCYTDVWALYYSEGLDKGKLPYRDQAVEYPAPIGGAMWVAAKAAGGDLPGGNPQRYFDVTAVLMLGCALAVTVGLVRSSGRRPWDAALFALAPTLLLHGLTNWDLLAVAFASLAIAAWAKRWPVAAGICIGLGTAAKLYPILFLIPLLALGFRARRLREVGRAAAATAVTLIAVNVPAFFYSARLLDSSERCHGFVDARRAWWQFYNLNRCRVADWDSLWYAAQDRIGALGWFGRQRGYFLDPATVNAWSLALFLAVLTAIVWLALTAPRRPRLGQLLFLTVAGFLLVSKVWSPQYVLWLVPLAVLARPRWRAFLVWQLTEVILVFTRFYFFIQEDGARATKVVVMGLDVEWFLAAIVLRDIALIVLMAMVVREIRYPHLDVVRRDGVDDPAGGLLDGADDRYDEPLPVELASV
ncbi:MAG: glycosyltransferase 87 family protein [Actinomycetota bacterium]